MNVLFSLTITIVWIHLWAGVCYADVCPTWRKSKTIDANRDRVHSVSFSADGKMLATGSLFEVKLWKLTEGKVVLHRNFGEMIRFPSVLSPDGKILAANSGQLKDLIGSHIILLDALSGERIAAWRTDHCNDITSLAFSPDGKMLASGGTKRKKNKAYGTLLGDVTLWDVTTGKRRSVVDVHPSIVDSVKFSPDGKLVAAAGGGASIFLWDAEDLRVNSVLRGHEFGQRVYTVAFSPDGETLASGSSDETIRIWDLATGEEVAILKGHVTPDKRDNSGTVNGVAFSPDGQLLASGSDDATVRIWCVATLQEIAKFECTDFVWSVAFSKDGMTLAAGVGGRERFDGRVFLFEK